MAKHEISAGQLTIHADRGRVMTSKPVAFLMADLGVTKTHSRPYVSDDNPYSESHFRTLKYRPEFPDRFGCIQDGRAFCQQFFPWYNDEHRHSGLGCLPRPWCILGRPSRYGSTPGCSRCRLSRTSRRFVRPSAQAPFRLCPTEVGSTSRNRLKTDENSH